MSASTTNKTIKALSTQTVVTFVTAGLSLVVFSVMSRLLTKEVFGYYAAITAITTIFNTLTEAGMGSAVIQKDKLSREYEDTAFSLAVITGLFFSIVLIILAPWLARLVADESMILPLRLMSISVFFCSLNSVTKANMTRKLAFLKIGVYNIIAVIIAAIIAITLAIKGFGVYAIVAQTITNAIFTFIIFFFNLETKPRWFVISTTCVKEIFGYGGWLTASCIFRVIYQQMDKLLMGRWLSISVLGAYNRPAGFISQITGHLSSILDTVLFPILSSIQNDKNKIKRAYDNLIYMVNLYSGFLCILFIVSNKIIIDIFFGSEWESLSVVFNILSLSLLLSINGRIMDCFIRSLAYVKMGFYLRIIACFITFGCLYIGKNYGIPGVALSVVISNYLIIISKMVYIGYKVKISLFHTFWLMIKPFSLILPPLVIFIVFRSAISTDLVWSLLMISFTVLYIISLLLLFPNLMGELLIDYLYKRVPVFEKVSSKFRRIVGLNN